MRRASFSKATVPCPACRTLANSLFRQKKAKKNKKIAGREPGDLEVDMARFRRGKSVTRP